MIKHLAWNEFYWCNRKLIANPEKITTSKEEITCDRCLNSFKIKDYYVPKIHLSNKGNFACNGYTSKNKNRVTDDRESVTCNRCKIIVVPKQSSKLCPRCNLETILHSFGYYCNNCKTSFFNECKLCGKLCTGLNHCMDCYRKQLPEYRKNKKRFKREEEKPIIIEYNLEPEELEEEIEDEIDNDTIKSEIRKLIRDNPTISVRQIIQNLLCSEVKGLNLLQEVKLEGKK